MAKYKMAKGEYLIKIRAEKFSKTFTSAQLLNLTVLYYNFDFSKEELIDIGNKFIENDKNLDDPNWCLVTPMKIKDILGYSVESLVRQFPYRTRIKMMGGIPKGDMQVINMANTSSSKAIYSMFLLVVDTMINERKWGKPEIELWWNTLIENADNYKKGMDDHFIAQYFKDEENMDITDTDDTRI